VPLFSWHTLMNRKKIIVFRFLTALIPLLMFTVIEIALHLIEVLPNRDLFVPVSVMSNENNKHVILNPRLGERYFARNGLVPSSLPEIFLKNKPENLYRVFVMGSSIVAGYPHSRHIVLSRILEQRLTDALPGKEVEVINLGIAAFNSYSLLDMLDEVLEQEPDVILIYAGHNEFYGGLGAASTATLGHKRWIVNLNLWLQEFKTAQAIKETIYLAQKKLAVKKGGDESARNLMGQVVGNKAIIFGDEVYERGRHQFEGNLTDILEKANDAGVPIIISDLVTNLRDTKPFVSIGAKEGESANKAYEEAKNLEVQGKFVEAKKKYSKSKDLDALRFRAPEEFNNIIRDAAKANDSHVVSMQKYFDEVSPNGIPGNNLFLEHLHPTVEGQFLMSEVFFDVLLENGLVKKEWLAKELLPKTYYRNNWPVTELDNALTKLRIMGLKDHWPFIPEHKTTNAIAKFNPTTRSEELAKDILFNRSTYKQAQNELAERFINEKQFASAIRSYRALAKAEPFDVTNFNNAATKLIAARQFQAAIPFLKQSLKLEDSFFANKWLGQTLISTKMVEEGIVYLEKAKQKDATDIQLLANLAKTYLIMGNKELAKLNMGELEALKPDHPDLLVLRASL